MLLANILLPLGGRLVRPTAFESLIVIQIAQYGSVRAVAVIVAVTFLAGSMLGALTASSSRRCQGRARYAAWSSPWCR